MSETKVRDWNDRAALLRHGFAIVGVLVMGALARDD